MKHSDFKVGDRVQATGAPGCWCNNKRGTVVSTTDIPGGVTVEFEGHGEQGHDGPFMDDRSSCWNFFSDLDACDKWHIDRLTILSSEDSEDESVASSVEDEQDDADDVIFNVLYMFKALTSQQRAETAALLSVRYPDEF